MEKLINAPSPVAIEFLVDQTTEEVEEEVPPAFEVGTAVTIEVIEDGKETLIDAKVGDNLRAVLLVGFRFISLSIDFFKELL